MLFKNINFKIMINIILSLLKTTSMFHLVQDKNLLLVIFQIQYNLVFLL